MASSPDSSATESERIQRAASGDMQAWAELLAEHRSRLQADERIGGAIRDPREDANREIGGPGEGS
jgi:hypothetical protein